MKVLRLFVKDKDYPRVIETYVICSTIVISDEHQYRKFPETQANLHPMICFKNL